MKKMTSILSAMALILCTSCANRYCCNSPNEMTLGLVQKEITTGMSQADVAIALGSPNIVTKDKENKEAWIYDKIASEAKQSSSSLFLILLAQDSSKCVRSQKTLTVVIKFDENRTVESVNYHSSKF